jgi:hypothetical protein
MTNFTGNTLAANWANNGSTFTNIAAAYLLQLQVLHKHHFCHHSKAAHIAGTVNIVADNSS